MNIIYLIIIFAVIYPFILFWDYKTLRNPETGEYKSRYISDSFVMFAPFAALYYHDFFWHALLLYFAPLNVYFFILAWLLDRKIKNFPPVEMIKVMGAGSFLLTIIIYYLFFHQGSLAETPTEVVRAVDNPWWVWWPFAVIIIAGWITALINLEKLLMIVGVIFLIIPFFSHHPLWAMLLAAITYLLSCFAIAQKQGNGAYVAVFFFYMIAQIAALIIYAVFF